MRPFTNAQNAVIASSGTVSAAVTVPPGSMTCLVRVPTIDSAAITLQISFDGTTFVDLYNIDDTQQGRTTATTGGYSVPFILFGPVKEVKIKAGATQNSSRTFQITFFG